MRRSFVRVRGRSGYANLPGSLETNAGGSASDHDSEVGEGGESQARGDMARGVPLNKYIPDNTQQADDPLTPRQSRRRAHDLSLAPLQFTLCV